VKSFSRSERVNEQIRRELADLIRNGIKDPRLEAHFKMVTLTDVEVTPDYAHAKVFYTALVGTDQRSAVDRGLKGAAGFLRRELGRRVRIHHIPELHFVYDESVERGTELSHLIDEAVKTDNARSESFEADPSEAPGGQKHQD
jgi:ribosome-binding factor A